MVFWWFFFTTTHRRKPLQTLLKVHDKTLVGRTPCSAAGDCFRPLKGIMSHNIKLAFAMTGIWAALK